MNNKCEITDIKDSEYVGYGGIIGNTSMIIISVVGIMLNSTFSVTYLKKMYSSKKFKKADISIMEQILCIIAITETLISVCWFINNCFIQDYKTIKDNCSPCKFLAHFESLLYLFDWMILSASLYQIKTIILNPTQILESTKFILKIIIYCAIFSTLVMLLGIVVKIGGASPMLTCFIAIPEANNIFKNIYFWFYFLIPLSCLIFGFYQVRVLFRSFQYQNEKSNRQFFKEYSYFIYTYIFFALILIISYIIDYFLYKHSTSGWEWFIFPVTLLSCSTPLIVGFIRAYRTNIVKKIINKFINRNEQINESMLPNNTKNDGVDLNKFERDVLSNLVIKHYIAISYCIGKSKYDKNDENNEIGEFNTNECSEYIINKSAILKDLDLAINEDIVVLEDTNIDIKVTEFNSSTFKKLRELEGISPDYLISVFQPKKGEQNLIRINGDILYINSTNKLFTLKTITKSEFLSYQKNVLPKIYNYLNDNKNSILCRVFGLYQIQIDTQKDVKDAGYMALIYNTYESLEDENDFFLKAKDNEKIMTISESTFKQYIGFDYSQMGVDSRKMTLTAPRNTLNIGNANNNNEKMFKISLANNENQKLAEIINQDVKFLKELNINGFKFLVCEKNISKEKSGLFARDSVSESTDTSAIKNERDLGNLKKYIFNSDLGNIVYSIAIVDMFKNN